MIWPANSQRAFTIPGTSDTLVTELNPFFLAVVPRPWNSVLNLHLDHSFKVGERYLSVMLGSVGNSLVQQLSQHP